MKITCSRLQDLTAADLMSTDLVLIPREMSLQGAAHLLHQAGISGAPVVDDAGRNVGVISSSDFVAWADMDKRDVRSCVNTARNVHSAWQVLDDEASRGPLVEDVMNHDPVTVSKTTPITRVSQMMVDAHIHRVIVVDEEHRPLGLVSSTDILGAVALLTPTQPVAGHEPHVALQPSPGR